MLHGTALAARCPPATQKATGTVASVETGVCGVGGGEEREGGGKGGVWPPSATGDNGVGASGA